MQLISLIIAVQLRCKLKVKVAKFQKKEARDEDFTQSC
jgi:hypothetical protein